MACGWTEAWLVSLVWWKCSIIRESSVVGVTVTAMDPSLDCRVSESVSVGLHAGGDAEVR